MIGQSKTFKLQDKLLKFLYPKVQHWLPCRFLFWEKFRKQEFSHSSLVFIKHGKWLNCSQIGLQYTCESKQEDTVHHLRRHSSQATGGRHGCWERSPSIAQATSLIPHPWPQRNQSRVVSKHMHLQLIIWGLGAEREIRQKSQKEWPGAALKQSLVEAEAHVLLSWWHFYTALRHCSSAAHSSHLLHQAPVSCLLFFLSLLHFPVSISGITS